MPLTDDQRRQITQRLDARERELQQEVRDKGDERAQPEDRTNLVVDEGEVGQERFMAGMSHVELQRDQVELRQVDVARRRLDEGTYGDCIDCGRAIPFERLLAQPVAERCVPCQQKWEQRHDAAPRFSP